MFNRKRQLLWSTVKVGAVVTSALLILFFTILFAGKIGDLFSPKVDLRAELRDVKGLRKGAPIWLSGVEIGSVKRISLEYPRGTVVTLSIQKNAFKLIRKDAQATVLTIGLLGDKYIELSPGSPEAPPVKPDDLIQGGMQVDMRDIMEASATSMMRVSEFVKKLDHLVEKVDKGRGTFAKFVEDPGLYDDLRDASKDLALTVKDIRDARGSLKLFIEDPSLYNRLLSASASLEEAGNRLTSGSGTLGRLIEDPTLYDRMASAASSFDAFGKKLHQGPGTLWKLAEDPALYDNLTRASLHLSSVLERIEKGEGVAGALVGDQELAVELKTLVGELRELSKDVKEHPKRYFTFSIF